MMMLVRTIVQRAVRNGGGATTTNIRCRGGARVFVSTFQYQSLADSLAAKRGGSQSSKTPADFWDDRPAFQQNWTNEEKNLLVPLENKQSEFGTQSYALEDIPKGADIQVVHEGEHYCKFDNADQVEDFLLGKNGWALPNNETVDDAEYQARLRYVRDYMVSLDPKIDPMGASLVYLRFPGNSANHCAERVNINVEGANKEATSMRIVATKDIPRGEGIFQNYNQWGEPPEWLAKFAHDKQIEMLHPSLNDYVS